MLKESQRSVSIDFLRFIAIFLVLGRHFEAVQGEYFGHRIMEIWHTGGWVGVDLFFVISGFLISTLLFAEYEKNRSINFGRFIVRRGFKIYPAFYALLLFSVLDFIYAGQLTPDLLTGAIHEALFVHNYFYPLHMYTWSLAVEEHFYIVFPLLLIALYKWNNKKSEHPFRVIPTLFIVTAAIELGLRLFNASRNPFNHLPSAFATHIRVDSLLFGVLLSYFSFYRKEEFTKFCHKYRKWLFAAGVLLLIPAFLSELETYFQYTYGFTFYYLGSGMLFCSLACHPRKHGIIERALAWIGKYSYSIFLWHVLVGAHYLPVLRKYLHFEPSSGTAIFLYFFLGISFGILMGQLIEWPVLKLRDRLIPH